ncbi:hypothetical protein NLJ89_g10550 [Agrocybe chaxingu]|uniref:Uncharacterized protein n=1 Tax=Agrocybe chaxingu TaxID=84603 RepID=A0A9W8JRI5_9AGAR|nr:hypothetical protein NLJ89_g10550 [Agrocybe chaxingu]
MVFILPSSLATTSTLLLIVPPLEIRLPGLTYRQTHEVRTMFLVHYLADSLKEERAPTPSSTDTLNGGTSAAETRRLNPRPVHPDDDAGGRVGAWARRLRGVMPTIASEPVFQLGDKVNVTSATHDYEEQHAEFTSTASNDPQHDGWRRRRVSPRWTRRQRTPRTEPVKDGATTANTDEEGWCFMSKERARESELVLVALSKDLVSDACLCSCEPRTFSTLSFSSPTRSSLPAPSLVEIQRYLSPLHAILKRNTDVYELDKRDGHSRAGSRQ